MTKPVPHTVAEVPGAVRKSPRVYTHAIVAEYNRVVGEARARRYLTAQAVDDYGYHQTRASLPDAGGPYPRMGFFVTADEVLKSRALLVEFPTMDAYIARRLEGKLEALPADGTPTVLQWSMSEGAARRALGSVSNRHPSWRNVRVVPVQRPTK